MFLTKLKSGAAALVALGVLAAGSLCLPGVEPRGPGVVAAEPPDRGGWPEKADPKAEITAADLHGYWESVEVTLVGGSSKLELRPDGKLLYAHRDVGTGWTTVVGGTWELKGGRVVLNAEFRNQDGKDVKVGEKKTEELSATRRGGEWRLGERGRPELKKVRNELSPADYLTHLKKVFKTSQFYSPPFDGPLAAKVREADLPKLVELMASKDRCAATVRPGAAVVRAVGAPEGSTVGHEAAVLIDSFRLGKAYPIADSSTEHPVDRDALLRWWKERAERAKPGKAEVARADPPKPNVPLAKAVREFNEAAGKDPVGKDQPALTTEEVVAAIRAWKLERGRRPPASDEVFAAFQKVAATGSLPPGAKLCSTTGWVTTDYEFDVWWVDLSIPDGKGRFYAFRVRDRKIVSRPVQKR